MTFSDITLASEYHSKISVHKVILVYEKYIKLWVFG